MISPTLAAEEEVVTGRDRLRRGGIVGGKYRLERLLGEGGMGVVWRAVHLELEAPVAIKLLLAHGRDAARLVPVFLREAKAAAAVRHRNVVAITDFGTDDGQPFMVMELLEGESLADRLGRTEALPVAEIVDIAAQCLSGLAAVHAAGILHRDLKPENVFLVADGDGAFPKLIDFGISRSLEGHSGSGRGAMCTRDGLVGTPDYMSPEQIRGQDDVDQRADVYAIGVMLYEALAGRLPYNSPNVIALLGAIVGGGATPLHELRPDLSPSLCAVVMQAMAPRENRFGSARDMRRALVLATSGVVDSTPPAGIPHEISRLISITPPPDLAVAHEKRRTVGTWAVLLSAFIAALGLGAWATISMRGRASPAAAHTLAESRPVSARAAEMPRLERPLRIPVTPPSAPEPVVVAPVVVETPPRSQRAVARRHHTSTRPEPARPEPAEVNGIFRDPGF